MLIPNDNPTIIMGVFLQQALGRSLRPRGGRGKKMPGTFTELRRSLEKHGFTVATGSGHPKATHPSLGDEQVVLPITPSDHRSMSNLIAEIRRRTGIDIAT